MPRFTTRDLALYAAKCCLDKGAEDVRIIDLPDGTAIYDLVVLASARSDRQAHACVEEVYQFCKKYQIPRSPVEGDAGWMLIDCMDVVVHVLTSEERARYDLDHLWIHGKDLDVEKAVKALPDPDAVPEASTKPEPKKRKTVPRVRKAAAGSSKAETASKAEPASKFEPASKAESSAAKPRTRKPKTNLAAE